MNSLKRRRLWCAVPAVFILLLVPKIKADYAASEGSPIILFKSSTRKAGSAVLALSASFGSNSLLSGQTSISRLTVVTEFKAAHTFDSISFFLASSFCCNAQISSNLFVISCSALNMHLSLFGVGSNISSPLPSFPYESHPTLTARYSKIN